MYHRHLMIKEIRISVAAQTIRPRV